MAHEIDFTTGMPAIAYIGRKPWHGYGQTLDEFQPLDVWRVAAGLNWEVEERQVKYCPNPALNKFSTRVYDGKKVLLRSDTKTPLSVVTDRYKVVQPEEVLQFFKDLIDREGFHMNTAGALRDGKRVWALAETGKDFTIRGDKVAAYLLLATSYDGTFATTAQFTSIRVVCNNTLGFSLDRGGEGGMIKIPHTKSFNSVNVKAELGLDESWTQFKSNIVALTEHKVTKRQAIEFFLTLLGVTKEEAVDGKQLSNVKKLLSFYESAPGSKLVTAKDTAWGLVNSVSYLTDHSRRSANNGTRFDSAAFGSGAVLKRKAYTQAMDLVEAA